MKRQFGNAVRWAGLALLIAALVVLPTSSLQAQETTVPGLAPDLAKLYLAYQAGDTAALVGEPGVDPEAATIRVQWETSQEVDNLGFNLYRSGTRSGPKRKLNQEMIPSQVPPGSPGGAVYSWLDETAMTGATYYYWLESLDVSGQAALFGPATAGGVRIYLPLVLRNR